MRTLLLVLALVSCSLTSGWAELPKVTKIKQFSSMYPASSSLGIPFHGCVEVDAPLPKDGGEYWLSVGHFIKDEDFTKIEVLVDQRGTILGARATFRGQLDEWKGERGYKSRKRVLMVYLGGDGPDLSKELPLAYDAGGDFGNMAYLFDTRGRVSWRIPQGIPAVGEAEYRKRVADRRCDCPECMGAIPLPHVLWPRPEKTAPGKEDE